MWLYILIGVIAIILIYFLITYNKLINLKNRVEEAFSTMDVYLKKRWDLIPNLIETVKGYAKHEKDTLNEIVSLRNKSYDNMTNSDKLLANNKVTKDISRLMLLAESYPDLKANQNFIDLSKQLTALEEDIANSRKYYNGTIRLMNNMVEMFPSNIVAKILGYKQLKMFEAKQEEKENIKVNLSEE